MKYMINKIIGTICTGLIYISRFIPIDSLGIDAKYISIPGITICSIENII